MVESAVDSIVQEKLRMVIRFQIRSIGNGRTQAQKLDYDKRFFSPIVIIQLRRLSILHVVVAVAVHIHFPPYHLDTTQLLLQAIGSHQISFHKTNCQGI